MNSTTSIFPENHCPDLTFRDRLVQPVPQELNSMAVGTPQVARGWC